MAAALVAGLACLALGGFRPAAADAPAAAREIQWQPWGKAVFAEAKREHKFVLLDLQAVWCHWCHVMEATTYHDPKVIALLQSRYIAVRVDQDAQPDLASRYQDYGWPATVVFNADGGEIVKRQGYLPPDEMSSMLQAIIEDPSPGPSVTRAREMTYSSGPGADADQLRRQLAAGYDWKLGGWGTDQKFLNWDNTEWCLEQAQAGDDEARKMAQQTLQAQLQLIDPVWGGVDQYSADGDWRHPHYEKIMQFQAENIRIYAAAFALWPNPVYLKTAEGIYGYVRKFLTSPEGVVYASQDADLVPGEHADAYFKLDDAGRRKLGLPRVDTHVYSRENGWFIEALAALYQVTGNERYREEAAAAAEWIIAHRAMAGGGFRHGEETSGPVNLADNLAMGRAFLSLYMISSDEKWLTAAAASANFMAGHFLYTVDGKPWGYMATAPDASMLFRSKPDFDENVSLARFANLLFHFTANARDRDMAQTALRYADSPSVVQAQLSSVGGLLLAQQELASDPLHITIVGRKSDPSAADLFKTALAFPCVYKEVQWTEGHTLGGGADTIEFPDLPGAAAYVCSRGSCSSPVLDPLALRELLARKTAPRPSP